MSALSTIQIKRSSTASKRPDPANLAYGELALNYNNTTPGVFYASSTGALIKVGPVGVSVTAPNSTPGGFAGNSVGEQWLDTGTSILKTYDGSGWVNAVPNGSTSVVGILQLTDSTSSTSTTTAATPNAVKSAYDLANGALPKAGGTMSGNITFSSASNGVTFGDSSQIDAISDSISTTSSVTAASSSAVKNAYDLANAALPKAGGTMSGTISFAGGQTFPVTGIQSASTTQPGVVQLNDTTSSTSVTQALTANQGKSLQDQINSLVVTNNITLAGTFNATTGLVDSVTTAGAAKGFVVGQALPTPAPANANYFVIVDVTGNTGPSGTPPYHVGDWWLSNGSVWQFLNVGYQPPTATTTQEGVVTLATTAQTQAGTNTSNAVTPSAAAATYLPLAGGSMGGDIVLFNQVPPTSSSPASKYYADQIAAGVKPQQAVAAATTAAFAGTVTYNNGTAGVGATLTLSTPITTLDGVTITTVGTRVLVKNQASALQNGIYTYTSGGATTVLTRATDANTPALLPAGASYYVTAGTVNGTQTYVQYSTVATVGTSSVSYSLTSTKPFHKYSQEWNVDPIAGDDVNGTGSEEQPYLTIAKALLSAGNTGGRVVLHQGTYNESITIPNLNLDITAANRSGATITGTVTVTAASSSIRIYGVSFTNTITHSGAGALYIQAFTSTSAINKTGSGYLELDDGADDSGTLSITGAGYVNYFNSRVGAVTVNNAAAVYTAQDMSLSGPVTVTTGTAQLISNSVFATAESSNAITAAAGTTVILKNTSLFTPSGVSARMALSGNYSLNDAAFDRANSTLGTNLAGVFRFDAIDNFGPYYANGSAGTSGQFLTSGGPGAATSWSTFTDVAATPTVRGNVFGCTTATNTALGSGSASNYVSGTCNVALGMGVALPSATGSGQLALGTSAGCWLTGNSTFALTTGAGLTINGNLLPAAGCTYTLGTALLPWQDIFLCAGSINFAAAGPGVNPVSISNSNNFLTVSQGGFQILDPGNAPLYTINAISGLVTSAAPTAITNTTNTSGAGTGSLRTCGGAYVACDLGVGGGLRDCAGSLGTAGQALISTGAGKIQWANSTSLASNYGYFAQTATQTNLDRTNGNAVTFNTTIANNNFSVVSNTQITAAIAGTYIVTATLQQSKTDSGTDEMHFWLKKSGTNVPNSAISVTSIGNGAKSIATGTWIVSMTAGQNLQVWWWSTDANMQLLADPAVAPYPTVPSATLSIIPV